MRPGSPESGFTLIELLLAVTIIGIAVVAVLGALRVGIDSGRIQRELATAELTARSLAEHVRAADYVACAQAADYEAGFEAPEGVTGTIAEVRHWDGDPSPSADAPLRFVDDCDVEEDDRGLQRIEVRVESASRAPLEIVVVKPDR